MYLAGSALLAVATVVLAAAWKLNPYILFLLAAAVYPYAIQLAFVSTGGNTDLLGNPTPLHLAALYVPAGAVCLRDGPRGRHPAPVPSSAILRPWLRP